MRSDARAFFRNRLLRDLNEYFLAFTQEIGDGRLMSLASRLIAMPTLVALITRTLVTLIAWALLARAAGLRRGTTPER